MKTIPSLCKKLKDNLIQLGILGIKLGQYMCNRSDISSPCMKNELKQLLSQNKIHSMLHTNDILNQYDYNDLDIGEIIGSGSMTQVYRCNIKSTGQDAVLKIKHPEVMFLAREIRVVKRVIYSLGFIPFFKGKMFRHMDWDEFFNGMEEQLDMNNEIRYMQIYENSYNSPLQTEISIPKMIHGTRDFIVMSYCEGKHLYEFSKEDPVYQKAHNLFVSSMIHMGFIYQFMHGDIHEGNILVKENGDISIIDFGVCIKLSLEQFMGIEAISKFEIDPSLENAESVLSSIIHPYTVDNEPLLLAELTKELYSNYKLGFDNKVNLLFEWMMQVSQEKNVIIRGNIMTYFMNVILLEGLSPYSESQQISTILALSLMRKNEFFMSEGRKPLCEYYDLLIKKTDPELIKKYNL